MTYKAQVTLKYDSTWTHIGGIYDDETLPEEHFTYEFPVEDATSYQIFKAFRNFMLAIGHSDEGVAKGAAFVAFNDSRSYEDMKKTADEFDLILSEDHSKKVIELENQIYVQENEIRDLKAKLSRLENPDAPDYTEEEIEAMTFENT